MDLCGSPSSSQNRQLSFPPHLSAFSIHLAARAREEIASRTTIESIFRMRFVKGVCIMGIVCTFVIILSLSASPVLSINDGVGAVELTTTSTSSFPRRMGIGGGDHRHQHREGGAGARISRDELKNRRPASHVPSTSTVTCDGTMEQRPALPPAPDDALQFFTIGDWGVRGLPVGSESQLSVARGMSCVARKHPPKFIATLGGVCFFGGGLGKRRACTS